ncbi:hypothetical protein A5635_02425 [Mycobacterium asiaticum]|uniref:Uncharacterized protein n=1 Tax=Mycobacterium asiaticum TaxID=1790 RepID=A0A1A3N9H1_MYCAS|nr:hypothetical protein A5635_02425 [Mycobacterium asiaticum]
MSLSAVESENVDGRGWQARLEDFLVSFWHDLYTDAVKGVMPSAGVELVGALLATVAWALGVYLTE